MISVIMPAKNEGNVIYKSLKEAEKVFSNYDWEYEIIVVDDGSTDDTYGNASRAAKENRRIKVVRKKNGGKGSAIKYGFDHCSGDTGDLVTFLDADLDLHPNQIPLFIRYLGKYDADVVIGSKRHPLSKVKYPLSRVVLSQAYQLFVSLLFDLNLKDTQAGLKLFKYEVLEDVLPRVLCKRYAFDLEVLVNANHRGYKIIEAPIELNWQRIAGRITFRDISRIALDTFAIFYRLRILKYYNGAKN